jgi:hypothetical protein
MSGPQKDNCGGEILMWVSKDQGRTWGRMALTRNSPFNHNNVLRPMNAQPDLYAFWSTGKPDSEAALQICFCDHLGKVYRLPASMKADFEKPLPVPVK